jgi:8-oxo-dGTP pyrophosphatase MutT (NUDIX family)
MKVPARGDDPPDRRPAAGGGRPPRPAAADHGGPPSWLRDLAVAVQESPVPVLLRPPPDGGRASAVLILFGEGPDGPDLLLVQRGPGLRRHSGQPAFPGGAIDPSDGGPVPAALREAAEEAGVDPAGVEVLTVLPDLFIARSGFAVTPVLAWWRRPVPVAAADPPEVTAVARVPLSELADPVRRLRIRHPSGMTGPAFRVRGMLVWGFTAALVDRLLTLGGWERPWDRGRVEELPPETLAAGS